MLLAVAEIGRTMIWVVIKSFVLSIILKCVNQNSMKKSLFILIGLFGFCTTILSAQKYYAYVAAESEDQVALVSFDGEKAKVEVTIPVGYWPTEIEGPHGLTVSPDKKFWFLSLAHGQPYGSVYKFSTETNDLVGKVELGLFPATMEISPKTGLLYVVNFNLHGDMVPSTVSVVDPEMMVELRRIETGVMPHGSRVSADGLKHYSLAMMSGELFEIDALGLKMNRILNLDEAGKKTMNMDHSMHQPNQQMDHAKMDHSNMDHGKMDHSKMKHSKVKPTWVVPHPDGKRLYVAGNGSHEILEIDQKAWIVTRHFKGGNGPYNVEVTPDGKKLVTTYKSEGTTGVWDLASGEELARIPNTRKVCHGIAITPDSKFAFVSVEGIGGEPGTVDLIDLNELKKVDYVEIGKQAGGIAFWKVEP